MSDIDINFHGLIAFIAATGLGLFLIIGILIASADSIIRARRKRDSFRSQRLFPQLVGMSVSLGCCVIVAVLLVLADKMAPTRALEIWLDRWVVVWLITVLALWPMSVFAWKKRHQNP